MILPWMGAFLAATILPCWSQVPAPAQEKKPSAVSFFNAAIGPTPLFLTWGGKQAFPAGLASGQSVSSLQVPAGSVPLQFRMDGFLDGVGKAEAAAGQLCTFIFYPGPAVKEGKDAGKKPLKLFSLPPVPEAENKKIFEWTVVYLGSLENVEIQANQKTLRLTHAQPVLAGQGERSFEITANGRSLAAVTVDTPENHVFVVFGDDPRELKGGLVRR